MNASPLDDRIDHGLLYAGILASFLSVILMLGSLALFNGTSAPIVQGSIALGVAGLVAWVLFCTLIGLPVAWLTMFAVGIPLWSWASRNGPISQPHAAKLGAMAGVIIGVIETLFAIGFGADIVHGEPGGLAKYIFDVACTIGIGAICGIVANSYAGPLKTEPPEGV